MGRYYTASVELKFRGDLPGAHGHGAALNRGSASIKAIMEAIESMSLLTSGIKHHSRSGTAAHFELSEAREKAYLELIERDAFLFHWLAEKPGLGLTEGEKSECRVATRSVDLPKVYFTKLASADPSVQVVFAVCERASSKCVCVGLGAAMRFSQAVEQALRELQVCYSIHPSPAQCPSDAIRERTLPNDPVALHRLRYADHHSGTRKSSVRQLLLEIVQNHEAFSRCHPSGLRSRVRFMELVSNVPRVRVVHATSKELLPIMFGSAYEESASNYRALLALSCAGVDRPQFHNKKWFLAHPLD